MEAIGKACNNVLNVIEAHCQLVSLISTLELDKWIEEFDWKNTKYPVYKKAHIYMKQVGDLLQFLRGTQDHIWLLWKKCVSTSLHSAGITIPRSHNV